MKYNKQFTPDNIQELKDNEIFVFGSNLAGKHGSGAAKTAMDKFGAKYGIGIGKTGQCYAIPTKDHDIETLTINDIKIFIDELFNYIKYNTDKIFYITQIGCGLAGYTPKDIAPLFKDFITLDNAILPEVFINVINTPVKLKVYKMTDENMQCRGYQYELGKKYKYNDKVIICQSGFHSCSTPQNCLNYYDNDGKNRLFLCEIELNGNECFENNDNESLFSKIATDNIIFLEEIVNLSKAFNSGNRNSGDRNSGNWNSGDRNSGDMNSGNWNSGNWNSGNFNTTNNLRFFFNKVTNILDKDIYYPRWLFNESIVWKYESEMSFEEKETYPYYKTTGGCLIVNDYKISIQESYNKATKEEQDSIEKLPNYDADVLFELFGIDRRSL